MHPPTVSLSRLNIETAYKYPIGAPPRRVQFKVTSKLGQHHDEIISQLMHSVEKYRFADHNHFTENSKRNLSEAT